MIILSQNSLKEKMRSFFSCFHLIFISIYLSIAFLRYTIIKLDKIKFKGVLKSRVIDFFLRKKCKRANKEKAEYAGFDHEVDALEMYAFFNGNHLCLYTTEAVQKI